mgnify:CR=1 FL=1|tara:strand:- start:254 stop:523 length:270 start_codon:yes stop_codon:yes gene_type:complete
MNDKLTIAKHYKLGEYDILRHLEELGLLGSEKAGGSQPSESFLGAHVELKEDRPVLHIDLEKKADFLPAQRFLKAVARTEKNLKVLLFH